MGTQQLLLIVLGVIIVGVAIAVGITIFNNQAYNANQQAVAQELTTYGTMVLQWWKTPESQGGAGQTMIKTGTTAYSADEIATAIGFNLNPTKTENGQFKVTDLVSTVGSETVTLKGLGTEKKTAGSPLITTIVTLPTGSMTVDVDAGTAF
jgi:hypothetical protein